MHDNLLILYRKQVNKHMLAMKRAVRAGNTQKQQHHSMLAIIFLHLFMETFISEAIHSSPKLAELKKEEQELNKIYKSLSFKNKWKKTFDLLHIKPQSELDDFLAFDERFRAPLVHPKGAFINADLYSQDTSLSIQTALQLVRLVNRIVLVM
ncbi:hypothetical protein KC726_03590 [Candidatus Woesebacteria bacterium]|nr:hypothetical protein [Candidatus Woesebacteria bacterium]